MTITLKISENTKEKMIEFYQDKKRMKTPPYAVFQADDADSFITLYESGKAVFQGMSADIDANMWKEMERHLNPTKKIEMTNSENKTKEKKEVVFNKNLYYSSSIGSDEVGTGDYFGPIVVTAAYVKKEDITFLEELGVKDSKKLTDDKIIKIVPEIIKKIKYNSIILTNKEYNERYSSDINMNKLKAILHNKAILGLKKEVTEYDYIIMDQFAQEYVYYNYLKESSNVCRGITFVTKGESTSLAVAAASMISRFIFLTKFEELCKSLDMFLPKGASNLVDEAGIQIVKKYGVDKLNEIAKLSFKNTEKIKGSIK